MLKPTINSGCPLNSDDTRLMTPGVSMLVGKCTQQFNNFQTIQKSIFKFPGLVSDWNWNQQWRHYITVCNEK